MSIESALGLPVVELPPMWWLNSAFRGGVDKRVGWWLGPKGCKFHLYVVVFRDGTRGPVTRGTNPLDERD